MDAQVKLKPELKIIREEEIPHLLIPSEMGAVLELIVRDKDGKVTDHRIVRSKSFVQQFLQLLFVRMAVSPDSAPISIRDIINTPRNVFCRYVGPDDNLLDVTAAATVVTNGIIIGTGSTAPTISDYQIGTIIPHATMNYSAMTFGAPAADATTSQITLTRNFANVSGASVTVNEIALYCKAWYASAFGNFMLIRDVIAGGIAVPNGQTLTVNYREQAVV